MKLYITTLLLLAAVLAEGTHTFLGTNIRRTQVFHQDASYNPKVFQKRIEYINFTIPTLPKLAGRTIQGIMAFDLNNSGASCNVTEGGLGLSFVKLRLKSDRSAALHYDIYVYA